MSYDLFLERFRDGKSNPSAEAFEAVWDVIAPFVTARRQGLTDDVILDLIVQMGKAGGMVIIAPGLPALVCDEAQMAHLPGELRELGAPALITNGEDLLAAIMSNGLGLSP